MSMYHMKRLYRTSIYALLHMCCLLIQMATPTCCISGDLYPLIVADSGEGGIQYGMDQSYMYKYDILKTKESATVHRRCNTGSW